LENVNYRTFSQLPVTLLLFVLAYYVDVEVAFLPFSVFSQKAFQNERIFRKLLKRFVK